MFRETGDGRVGMGQRDSRHISRVLRIVHVDTCSGRGDWGRGRGTECTVGKGVARDVGGFAIASLSSRVIGTGRRDRDNSRYLVTSVQDPRREVYRFLVLVDAQARPEARRNTGYCYVSRGLIRGREKLQVVQ